MRLRVDPWQPNYGASAELEADLAPPVGLQLDVEVSGPWSPIPAPKPAELPCCAFIDGVRRIEVQLFAEERDTVAPGIAGSWLRLVDATAEGRRDHRGPRADRRRRAALGSD